MYQAGEMILPAPVAEPTFDEEPDDSSREEPGAEFEN